MAEVTSRPVGVLLAGVGPGDVGAVARIAERSGYAGVWAPEDYPERPATVMAALAIAVTERIEVGTGVMSLTTRHPLLTAMDLAALSDAAPGRFVAGLGLGLPLTLASIGCLPDRPVTAVRQRLGVVSSLLRGEEVTFDDGQVRLSASRLAHAPAVLPALALGGLGPRMIDLVGELGDVLIVSSLGSAAYLEWAVDRVTRAAAARGRARPRIIAFAWYHLGDTDAAGLAALRPNVAGALGALGAGPLTDADGWSEELTLLRRGDGPLIDRLPETWVDEMVVAGTPEHCARGIERRLRAGADQVVLCPMGADPVQQLQRTAREVFPLLSTPTR